MDPRSRKDQLIASLIAGAMAGVAGLLTFLVIHHFWIRPIWFILPIGLVIAAIGGVALGWSYAELQTALPSRPWTFLALAALIAAILAPSILIGELRPALLNSSAITIEPGDGPRLVMHLLLELILPALLVGAVAGWFLGRTPQAALATAVAGGVFALGPGHNIPFLANTPAAGKGLILLLAVTLVGAAVLVEVNVWLLRR